MSKLSNRVKIVIFLFLLLFYFFINKLFNFSIPCPFYYITHLYCPGCGITRMFFSILHLEFYQAFRYNPLVFILLILSIIYLKIKFILKKFNINIKIPEYIWYILLVIIIVYGILRNIPELSWLTPTEV